MSHPIHATLATLWRPATPILRIARLPATLLLVGALLLFPPPIGRYSACLRGRLHGQ